MFKKDDYIVCLEGEFKKPGGVGISDCARKNYIVKQDIDDFCLNIQEGIGKIGQRNNIKMTFDKSQWLKDWRYATPEEIEEYDRLGKPYDVTTLNSFVLPKKWYVKGQTYDQDVILTNYFNHLHNGDIGAVDCSKQHTYYYSEKINDVWWNVGKNISDSSFKEITYEQFVKYVLNQNTNSEDMFALISLLKQVI